MEKLRLGKVLIRNRHALEWETAEQIAKRKSVDKRGAKSDEAYVRDVLGEMASAHNILVINDEAHHAWRVPAGGNISGVAKDEISTKQRNGSAVWIAFMLLAGLPTVSIFLRLRSRRRGRRVMKNPCSAGSFQTSA